MAILNFLKSTILSKVVMAVTGIILLLFIIGHTAGNMQVYIGREHFNHYAHFLQGLGEILWIMRIGLFLSLVLHIITSIRLSLLNAAAKPVQYQVKKYIKARLNSRTMIWTGIMIFAFLTYHILHFTVGATNPEDFNYVEYYQGEGYASITNQTVEEINQNASSLEKNQLILERHDVYKMVVLGFRNPLIALAYIIGVFVLGFHLSHAIQSCFQTLGVTGPKFTPRMVKASNAFAVIIVLCLVSIPFTILTGLVGGAI